MDSLVAYGSDSDEEGQQLQHHRQAGQQQEQHQRQPQLQQRGNGGLAGQPSSDSAAPTTLVEPRPPRRQSDLFDDDDDDEEADAFGNERRRANEDEEEEEEEEELDLLLEKGAKFSDSAMFDVGGSGSGGGGSTPGPGYTPRSVCSTDEPMDMATDELPADAIQHRDLPPSPRGECDSELAQRFVTFFEKKERGVDMNSSIKRRKDYINPALYEALRNAYEIDEKGTCFPRGVFDPNAFSADDFYDSLGDHQAALEQRRKKMVQQQQEQQLQHHHHSHGHGKRPASFPTVGGSKAK